MQEKSKGIAVKYCNLVKIQIKLPAEFFYTFGNSLKEFYKRTFVSDLTFDFTRNSGVIEFTCTPDQSGKIFAWIGQFALEKRISYQGSPSKDLKLFYNEKKC